MNVDGWIHKDECDLVLKYMDKETGSILEVGCAIGRLFNYLYTYKPNWDYSAIDPFEKEGARIQVDLNKSYFDSDNLDRLVTVDEFKANCPFSKVYPYYFDDFESTDLRFDIISIGATSRNINYYEMYYKAYAMLKPGGVIIGRNLYCENNYNLGDRIKESVCEFTLLEQDNNHGSFVIR